VGRVGLLVVVVGRRGGEPAAIRREFRKDSAVGGWVTVVVSRDEVGDGKIVGLPVVEGVARCSASASQRLSVSDTAFSLELRQLLFRIRLFLVHVRPVTHRPC
jgi:hypothetical protein